MYICLYIQSYTDTFLMEPSQKSHALNWFYFCSAMPDDVSENVITHIWRL